MTGKATVAIDDVGELPNDSTVKPDLTPRETEEVVVEGPEPSVELLKDDSLNFDFADLFQDYLFSEFLQDEEALLNDGDFLRTADELGVFDKGLLEVARAIKVVQPVKVVKLVQGGESAPVVKGEPFVGAGYDGGAMLNRDVNLNRGLVDRDVNGYRRLLWDRCIDRHFVIGGDGLPQCTSNQGGGQDEHSSVFGEHG